MDRFISQIISLILFLVLLTPSHAQQTVDATIQGGVVRPISIAIPSFHPETQNATDLGRNIAAVVASDLRSTGLFRDMPTQEIGVGIGDFDQAVDYANWSDQGAEVLLKASVAQSQDGQVQIKFRVFDVVAQSEVGEGVQLNASVTNWRRLAHKVADSVYTRLSGEGPYFDSRIVFVSESGPKGSRRKSLALMDSDGANLRYLTNGDSLVLAPRWASNARDIIFTRYSGTQPQVVLMNTNSGATQVLSDLPGLAFAPRFSPDGSSLAVSMVDDAGNTDIYRIDMASGSRTRLTQNPSIETAPSFSPDGGSMVFESDQSGTQQIYIMPATGGTAKRVSNGSGRYATPVWSPRGDLIAFTKQSGGKFHIGVMNIDGSGERLLTESFLDEAPSWAPNGRVLIFFRETPGAKGAPKLYTISLTGQNLVPLATPDHASDPSWSNLLR